MIRAANYCECGDHAFAPLTKGHVALVSPEDAHLLDKYKWHAQVGQSGHARAARHVGNRMVGLGATVLGISPPREVDHINHIATDDRRQNLRPATRAQNAWNRRAPKHSRQPAKGVRVVGSLYHARITVLGKRITIGKFETLEQAAQAYDAAAQQHFGQFAVLNQSEQAA